MWLCPTVEMATMGCHGNKVMFPCCDSVALFVPNVPCNLVYELNHKIDIVTVLMYVRMHLYA